MASWWQGVAGLRTRRRTGPLSQEALCQSCQLPAHAQYLGPGSTVLGVGAPSVLTICQSPAEALSCL